MKRWRTRTIWLLGAGAASLAFAIPAAGQRDRSPESLLPPGFGEPPPPRQAPPPPPASATPAPSATPVAPGTPAATARRG